MDLKYIAKNSNVSPSEFYTGFSDNSVQWNNSCDKCLHISRTYF